MGAAEERLEPNALKEEMEGCLAYPWLPGPILGAVDVPGGTKPLSWGWWALSWEPFYMLPHF